MAHDYIQIPPDSTGKKIRHTGRVDMELLSILIDFNAIERGTLITGKTSGATGKFLGFAVELGENYCYVGEGVGTFQAGEIITINSVDAATIDSFVEQHTPVVTLADADTPNNRAKVDSNGSIYTRYSEGDLGFDAFGHAQFSQISQIQSHTFLYGDNPSKYWDQTLNGGSITYVPNQSCILLTVNDQSGSKASRTTNQYYPYNPGDGNEVLMSLRKGDDYKEGLVRRWGLFDDNDGIFFEVSGSWKGVVQRSSASGTVVEERVSQADVNGDPLNNPNVSNFLIDTTKYNLFWIDYQWLGVGKVRMGAFSPDGKRITMHTFKNPNSKTLPWAKRGTLPLRVEQFNYANTSGTSEMRLVCMTVARQADQIVFQGPILSKTSNRTAVSGSSLVPLFSARPKVLHNGLTNRTTMIPTDVEVINEGDPIKLVMFVNPTLTGSSWAANPNPLSATELDDSSTSFTGGTPFETLFFGTGTTHRELEENLDFALQLNADGVTQPIMTFSTICANPAGNANVTVLVRWKEAH